MTGADPRLARVKRGDPITAKGWNAIIDQVAVRQGTAQPTRPLFPVINVAGEDIPPFSVLSIYGPSLTPYTFQLDLGVDKPSVLSYSRELQCLLTNGPNEIKDGKTGLVSFIDPWCPTLLIAGGTVAAWDVVGADGSFRVATGKPGFIALHAATVGNPVWCISDVNHNGWVAAITTSGVSARSSTTPGSGNVDLKAGSPMATTESVSVKNPYASTIVTGTYVTVQRDLLGIYWIVGADCA